MFQLPEMILFDYGQTLIDETDYDTIRGNHAVLQRAVSNPRQINASQLQKLADELSKDMTELFGPEKEPSPEGSFPVLPLTGICMSIWISSWTFPGMKWSVFSGIMQRRDIRQPV